MPEGKPDDLFGILRTNANKVLTGIAIGQLLVRQGKRAHDAYLAATQYLVTVKGTDAVYEDLHAWLVEQVPSHRRRSLTAVTGRRARRDEVAVSDESRPRRRVGLIYDGHAQRVVIKGRKVRVGVSKQEVRSGFQFRSEDYDSWESRLESLVFTCPDAAARDAVLELLQELADAQSENPELPRLHVATPWGSWRRRDDLPIRPLDSVILARGQMERLAQDLEQFLTSEDFYNVRAIPWRRGYVFHGPPGTGKTSAARALASHCGLDVRYVPLGDMGSDSDLISLVSSAEERSMLLLEDVDVFHAATERTDDAKGATLSGLLNAVDGVATPHGLVVIMTTNNIGALDAALLRPGRVDLVEHFDWADAEQVSRLFRRFFPGSDTSWVTTLGRSLCPAEVVDAMVRYRDDAEAAAAAIRLKAHRAAS